MITVLLGTRCSVLQLEHLRSFIFQKHQNRADCPQNRIRRLPLARLIARSIRKGTSFEVGKLVDVPHSKNIFGLCEPFEASEPVVPIALRDSRKSKMFLLLSVTNFE